MDLKGQKVIHEKFGVGVVTEQTDAQLSVSFLSDIIKFQYPVAFKKWLTLCDAAVKESMEEEIKRFEQKSEQDKATGIGKQFSITPKVAQKPKRKKIRPERPNIAFKCNYCDGGKSSSSIGFCGICSDRIMRYNIEEERRTWCCSEDSPCLNYLYGNIERSDLEEEFSGGGYVCYESQMLRDWKAMAGIVQKGERKGQPMRLRNVQPNSLCVLTTREPGSSEAERIIFAVFLVDESYGGDSIEEGFVSTQSKFKISLSQNEARKMLFWRYHANQNKADKEAWSSGLHRYLTDIQAIQILRDIAELKVGTKDAVLASEFLSIFGKIAGISIEDVCEPSGVLAY